MIKYIFLILFSLPSFATYQPQTIITDATTAKTANVTNANQLKVDAGDIPITANQGSPPWVFSLPSGAATSALQTSGNASLVSIDSKLTSPLAVTATISGTVPTSSTQLVDGSQKSQLIDGSGNVWGPRTGVGFVNYMPIINLEAASDGAAVALRSLQIGGSDGTNLRTLSTDNTGKLNILGPLTDTQLRAVPVPISGTVSVPSAVNLGASGSSASATVSTSITLTAPANAVGFVLMNLDVSTTNMRWAIGRTSSSTLGQQLQPGRDTGFIPCGVDVSIVAESGTVTYDIQWVTR